MTRFHFLSFGFTALALAACSSEPQGVRIIGDGVAAAPGPVTKQVEAIRVLTGPEIAKVVVGKTFQYTRKDSSGFVIYNADGTLTVQDDKKASSTGKWSFANNQYCESYSVTQPMECGTFRSTGDAYFAGNSRLVDLRI
jgi:hypothetical protein